MNKPKLYDETKVGGFTPLEVGGHHLILKHVEETKSKKGNHMLVVSFDTAGDDRQPAYMTEEFKNDIRPEKKWPRVGTTYIVTEDKDGNCSKKFKSFIKAFEDSNQCEAIWGAKFAAQFTGKRIGGVFGEVESEYNGKINKNVELRFFIEDAGVDSAKVPDPQLLDRDTAPKNSSGLPWITGDELSPF